MAHNIKIMKRVYKGILKIIKSKAMVYIAKIMDL